MSSPTKQTETNPPVTDRKRKHSSLDSTETLTVDGVEVPDVILNRSKGIVIDRGRTLGKGQFGVVFQSKWEKYRCAVKAQPLRRIQDVRNEAIIHHDLSHKNIVRYLGEWEDDELFYIAMELCDGNVEDMQGESRKPLPIEIVRWIALEVAQALWHMHERDIMHRDIKSANIMTAGVHCKVSDFGLSRMYVGDAAYGKEGTPAFWAPEIGEDQAHGKSADIYALASMLHELISGQVPKPDQSELSKISKEADDFISLMICQDPLARITAKDILQHPFVKEALPPKLPLNRTEKTVTSAPQAFPAAPRPLKMARLPFRLRARRQFKDKTEQAGPRKVAGAKKDGQKPEAAAPEVLQDDEKQKEVSRDDRDGGDEEKNLEGLELVPAKYEV
ncbi:MAG: kinase-like domain-containing protein [Linnemannia gamsii]|nr:MAG: kinase-like domain-containing protein [Linnemannia gamsii]